MVLITVNPGLAGVFLCPARRAADRLRTIRRFFL